MPVGVQDAKVRVLLPVLPAGDPWGDRVHSLALRVAELGFPVVYLATNGAVFQGVPRWSPIRNAFVGSTAPRFVNLVMAKAGDFFNKVSNLGKTERGSAIEELWTADVPNLLVAGTRPIDLSRAEYHAAQRYDVVYWPSSPDDVVLDDLRRVVLTL